MGARCGTMGGTLTIWRLVDGAGLQTSCVLTERDQRWQLVIHRGREVLLAERHSTDGAALARANQIWEVYRELGWTEPFH